MTLNCELYQSEFSVLSGRLIIKLTKICFLCTYINQMIIEQGWMCCFEFIYAIFLLMLFLLFSKVFTKILKIYEQPKIYNKIFLYNCLHKNHVPGQFYVRTSSGFWTLLKMDPWGHRTLLELNKKKNTR